VDGQKHSGILLTQASVKFKTMAIQEMLSVVLIILYRKLTLPFLLYTCWYIQRKKYWWSERNIF